MNTNRDPSGIPSPHTVRDEMLLCLCAACAHQFYESPGHRVRRADRKQSVKDRCDFCNYRYGFDYIVINIEKSSPRRRPRPARKRVALM